MRELTLSQKAEQSIHKKYRKTIWRPFIEGIKRYQLIQENDIIAVCISGGKDSMLLAKLMQSLQRHSRFPFQLHFMVMNPGYNEINLQKVIANAEMLEIPITIFDSNIFQVVQQTDRTPCYLCARMRRGYLYAHAQKLGCNKIALGHHLSDVVETTLMGMLFGAQYQVMMPKLKSQNFHGMELIRPMYCIEEDAIHAWKRYNALSFIACACPLSENCNIFDASGGGSKRQEVKSLLHQLKRDNKDIEKNVFKSLHTVNLDTTIAYKQNDKAHSFLDNYDLNK
ncbi:MAG: tRNA 2-thiocytidine biosynthesis protein TtcA [Defluviitaleaceae bacterium]|nr:tRNA 2-thiocytidine biosynthesis protein TtcA [Defluviitaleaceae bacterium]